MALPKIIVRERIYLPLSEVPDPNEVKRQYTRHMFKDVNCAPCEYKVERPCSVCEACPNYNGVIKLFAVKEIGGQHYIGVPVGDKRNVEKKAGIEFSEFRVVDKRTKAPFDYKIKFIIKLRPHQIKLAEQFMDKQYGMLEAPPRTGKTVMMLYLGLQLGQRMVLLANQHEYLQQFIWHIEGNEEEGIPKCTNLPEIEAKVGKKLFGFPKTDEDFENMQFMVMTYQQFLSLKKGSKRFRQIAANVGTVAVDEAHRVGADSFAKVLNKFPTRYRFGVTGTVERKDKRHLITKQVIGPVVARTTVESMPPKVFVKDTGIKIKRDPKLWVYKMKALTGSKPRNQMIVDRAIKDVKNGHSVVIPLIFTKHIREITNAINEAAGKPIAESFMGGGTEKQKEVRRKILSRAKSGETKVIVGTRSLLQLGLNVPRWSCIYTVIPISNQPNYKQETSRVRTPMEGKRQPIIRLYYDSAMGASVACARNCVDHMKKFKYEFSTDETTQESLRFLQESARRRRGGYSNNDDADFKPQRTMSFEDDDEPKSFIGRARRR